MTPKKSSAKKSTPVKAETSAIQAAKSSSKKPKRALSEIDEIFAKSKKRKLEKEIEAKKVEKLMKKNKKIRKMIRNDKGNVTEEKLVGLADEPVKPRKKTGDGLRLYSEDELGIANPNSGGTRLCPFDCDCCF